MRPGALKFTVYIDGEPDYEGERVLTLEPGETAINIVWLNAPKLSSFDKLEIYPNPVKTELVVSGLKNYHTAIVSNIIGQEVARFEDKTEIKYDTENLEGGIYFVTISEGKESRTVKIVKN